MTDSLIHHGADIDPDTCIDLYGLKQIELIHNNYLLSSKYCDKPINRYGADMSPLLQNILHNNPGDTFAYSNLSDFRNLMPASAHHHILEKQEALGYHFASKTKYYKLGYYILHPWNFIKKRLSR